MLSEATRAFLESTSIRGVGRIFKSPSRFLSRLWALFVLGSTTLLFYSAVNVTLDYLQYDVNIQTRLDLDDVSPFPAVSVCNNQPFSKTAFRLWADKAVPSPTEFNWLLRQQGLRLLNELDIDGAYERRVASQPGERPSPDIEREYRKALYASKKALQLSLPMDSSRLYFQNLQAAQALMLGHSRNDSFVDCIFKYGSAQVQGTKGCYDDMLDVTLFSHPNYFNCFTLQFREEYIQDVFSLALIIWLGPGETYGIRHKQGFLFDIFEQAYGLRVAVHEPGSHPAMLQQGIQTEPGKMNEIKYQAQRFVRANTPRNPCLSEAESRRRRFADHGQMYNYDQELCLNTKVQEVFLRTCGCLYVELPLVMQANASHPYCGFVDDKLFSRAECAKGIDQRRIRQQFETTDCLPRCTELTYRKELSVTKWRDTPWMLHWIKEVSERWNNYFMKLMMLRASPASFRQDLSRVKDYLRMANITDPLLLGNSTNFHFDERFTYVMVKRRANNTLVQQEKIVLTVNALFSRIGGLCSMYIGLTLAFFVECIELIYRLVAERAGQAEKGQRQHQQQQQQQQLQVLDVTEQPEQLELLRPPPQPPPPPQEKLCGGFVWLRQDSKNGRSNLA